MKKTFITLLSVATSATSASTSKGFETSLYGFIKTSANAASGGVASFNNLNMSAPTHAVAQTRDKDKTSRFGFQTQQSRIGAHLKKQDVSGQLEFDFVDFNKSSPTTQMVPRVRIAAVTYVWGNNRIVVGQDWDIFSPTNSFTYNHVGNYFLSGNVGFMRQQVQYHKTLNDFEISGALGLATSNPTISDNETELSKSPSYALRVQKKFEKGRIGLSGIYGHLKYLTGTRLSHDSYGANAFYEHQFSAFSLKGEAYYGLNMANLGTLGLGKGTADSDIKEYGGHLTANYKVTENVIVFGGAGIGKIDNKSELVPFAPQGNSLNTSAITSPGIRQNFVSRVGIEYKVSEDFSFLSEFSRYETDSKLGDNVYKTKVVGVLESGVQLRF